MATTVPPGSYGEPDLPSEMPGYTEAPYEVYSTGAPFQAPSAPVASVKNYMVPAVLVTLFCFIPTGIAAIVYASKVNPALQLGNLSEAMRASSRAKQLCWISLAIGVVAFLITFAAAVGSADSSYN